MSENQRALEGRNATLAAVDGKTRKSEELCAKALSASPNDVDVLLSVARRANAALPTAGTTFYDYLRGVWSRDVAPTVGALFGLPAPPGGYDGTARTVAFRR